MFTMIRKRDGREVSFDETKITDAIFRAAKAVGGADRQMAMELTLDVLRFLKQNKLVKSQKKKKTVFYSLADEHVKRIFNQGLEHIQEGL